MTESDYIAAYIKEKHPEVLKSRDFSTWKFDRKMEDTYDKLCEMIISDKELMKRLKKHMHEESSDE